MAPDSWVLTPPGPIMPNVHIKIYCGYCGHLLKHEAQDPVQCKNFIKVELDPCEGCVMDVVRAKLEEMKHGS